jgi:hypothetical protein
MLFSYYGSLIILLPGIVFAIWAQYFVKSTYEKYSSVQSKSGMTGKMLARTLLDNAGLFDVTIENIPGNLTDHFDPRKNVVRLSASTFSNSSVAALGVVAHEIGHVIQKKENYLPFSLRSAFVPVAQFGSSFSWIVFFFGLFMANPLMINIGIWLFSAVVIFSLLTLPVEFDASKRAVQLMQGQIMVTQDESVMVKKVLNAAAMTYVAATLMSILSLLRMVGISRR